MPDENGHKQLTPRQARFIVEYQKDLNATQAAIRAGYSELGARTQGSKLLAHPNIKDRISAVSIKLGDDSGLSVVWVLKELKNVYNSAKKKKQFSTCNRSLELIGKHFGMFEPEEQVQGDTVINVITGIQDSVGSLIRPAAAQNGGQNGNGNN